MIMKIDAGMGCIDPPRWRIFVSVRQRLKNVVLLAADAWGSLPSSLSLLRQGFGGQVAGQDAQTANKR
ncbi:MAG: hypothetical protein EA353_01335 [Puniceicoccaceae bacterium]|nr:MAG: hypothetical protein EA353_01335 [Puniceicoccaceae bacterium]